MKVFIRTSELSAKKPNVVAFYPDSTDIGDDAHGDGMTVLILPQAVVTADRLGMIFLDESWRERAGSLPVDAEAKRRIDEAFTVSEQVEALRDLVQFLIEHGADVSNWPADAKERKALLDERWRYIDEVRERARAHGRAPPFDPSSDKAWPRRMTKK